MARPKRATGSDAGIVMLVAAFTVLGIAVLLGSFLAVLNLRTQTTAMAPWPIAALHALLGIGGLACLALALRGPPRGLDQGTGSFGMISAAMIVLAAIIGGRMFAARRRRQRPAGGLIGIHAVLAIGGFVVLAAYVFAG